MKNLFTYQLLVLLLFGAVLTGCKKDIIEEPLTNSTPVFNADVTIGSDNFLLEAGKDSAYMNTYTQIINGVKCFSGKLGTPEDFVEVGVFNGNIDMALPFSLKSFQGPLSFVQQATQPLAVLSIDNFDNASSIQNIVWFKDGVQAGVNVLQIMEPGRYNICAEIHYYDGESATVCNELILGFNLNAQCQLNHYKGVNGHYLFWTEGATPSIQQIDWFVDGTKVFTGMEFEYFPDNNIHTVSAEIKFSNGTVRKKTMLVDSDEDSHFIEEFTFAEQSSQNIIRWDFGVVMNIRRNGVNYTTMGVNNIDSSLEISDISYYGLNAQGHEVYKCVGTINAFVKEVGTGNISPVSITATFGLEMN